MNGREKGGFGEERVEKEKREKRREGHLEPSVDNRVGGRRVKQVSYSERGVKRTISGEAPWLGRTQSLCQFQ